ncbi:MAG: rod shape-determining protein RodA, partial [Clostridia bacterium]|nr:rod shape-determining protein RodA [Clostridia bacterium]
MKYRNLHRLSHFDNILFILTALTGIVGIVAIFSATRSMNTNSNVIMQTVSFFIGLILMFICSRINYQAFGYTAIPIYIVCILMLIAVLIFGTTGTWGARSWIRIGPVGIQPSELCKVGFAITFAKHLSAVKDDINKPKTLAFLMLHLAILIGLIMLEPDAGSSMVFCFMAIVMLFVAGLSVKYILSTFLLFLATSPLIYFFLLSDYQKRRIQVFFNPELDKLGSGYNVIQSKIAVGSGTLLGKGFLKGTQNQLGFLPTKHTDFIFSVISEEFGFLGAVCVVVLLFMIIIRCLKIAQSSGDLFGRYICIGIAAMLIFHTFENIGMCIGLMPVTGIPLPFISYGGTSLI